LLHGGRATADACLNRSYVACACGKRPRRGPPSALSGQTKKFRRPCRGKHNHFLGRKLAVPSAKSMTANYFGVGLRQPCRGQTFGGMLGAMARIGPARLATRPTTTLFRWLILIGSAVAEGRAARTISQIFRFSLAAFPPESPCSAATCLVKTEPHTGVRPSVRVCVGLIKNSRGGAGTQVKPEASRAICLHVFTGREMPSNTRGVKRAGFRAHIGL